ncbi:MAG: RHS repeat-associated core domain-containing protein [Cryomorphaceae bacterium]|nr:RHS repeat-associated core domain-containing protein [Cryomorphaceae bacterium]
MNHLSTSPESLCHPDYLGSIEWVTNADGRPGEYFWYSPWGETLQAYNSWRGRFSSPFKFTGHIEDEETGLTYAGARYYPARESQWLSVDPLAEHFPSWTPYHYVHNNPVNLVDPDGRDIYVTGENADEYICQLQSRTKMEVYFDAETGRVSFEGKARNKFDRALLEASTNEDYDLRIETTNDGSSFFGGAFLGASLNEETGKIDVNQIINTNVTASIDKITKRPGLGVGHETIEAYLIGEYMSKNGISSTGMSASAYPNPIFLQAHKETKSYGVGQEDFYEVFQDWDGVVMPNRSPVRARGKYYLIHNYTGKIDRLYD